MDSVTERCPGFVGGGVGCCRGLATACLQDWGSWASAAWVTGC